MFVFLYYGKWHDFEGLVTDLYKLCTFLWPITVQEISMAFVKLDLCRDVQCIQLLKQGQFLLSFIFSPTSLKCRWIFCVQRVSYILLSFHWNTNVFILCEQRPSLISFSFISSLISLWNTDKFFFSCTETQLLLSLLFRLIFLYEKQIFLFLYRDHHLFHYLPFFWHYFMKYLSVNSFSFISSL